jgi:hypothetical protein
MERPIFTNFGIHTVEDGRDTDRVSAIRPAIVDEDPAIVAYVGLRQLVLPSALGIDIKAGDKIVITKQESAGDNDEPAKDLVTIRRGAEELQVGKLIFEA